MEKKWFAAGAVAAVLFGGLIIALPGDGGVHLSAGLLWATAGIYVGFGIATSRRAAAIETASALAIGALALLGTMASPWFLVAGWLLHPIWDALHEVGLVKTHLHPAVVPFCIVFDVALAAVTVTLATGIWH